MIAIESAALAAPVQIRDDIVERFHVWAGPGTSGASGGFIVDWGSPVDAAQLDGLQRCQVSFFTRQRNGASRSYDGEERLSYVVSYAYDAATGEGYVYIPGARDAEHRINAASIYRGPRWEGRWFRATAAWQEIVTPLLTRARRPE